MGRRPQQAPSSTEIAGYRATVALATVGFAVAAYLTYLHYSGAEAAFCSAGSGCDVVRSSRYSEILGVPVALVGAVGYLALAALALAPLQRELKALSLFSAALAGFVYSAYLTYLEVFTIGALCAYCLASFGMITAILVVQLVVTMRSGSLLSPRITAIAGGIAALVLLVSVATCTGEGVGVEDSSYAVELARHLTDSGAVMYGAYWCPHCQEQKDVFGKAFDYVKYVECAPEGKDANPLLCEAKGIKGYPTWEIGGQMHVGVMPLAKLAELSGFIEP